MTIEPVDSDDDDEIDDYTDVATLLKVNFHPWLAFRTRIQWSEIRDLGSKIMLLVSSVQPICFRSYQTLVT